MGDPIAISGANRTGLGDMLDEVVSHFDEDRFSEEADERVHVAIIGKPNVGKSSLMNALLKESRAIVTAIPGTTRDTIEETLSIGGVPVILTDTAGIRDTDDVIEKIGIEKSKEAFNRSDLVIFIVDLSRELDSEDREIIDVIGDRKVICLMNKSDLEIKLDRDVLRGLMPKAVFIEGSMTEDQGVNDLENAIKDMVYGGQVSQKTGFVVTNVRHGALLKEADQALTDALGAAEMRDPLELLEIDVNHAYESLGLIIGEEVGDDIINEVFRRFCLGK